MLEGGKRMFNFFKRIISNARSVIQNISTMLGFVFFSQNKTFLVLVLGKIIREYNKSSRKIITTK